MIKVNLFGDYQFSLSYSFEVFIKNAPKAGLDYPSKVLIGYSFAIKELRLIEKIMSKVK